MWLEIWRWDWHNLFSTSRYCNYHRPAALKFNARSGYLPLHVSWLPVIREPVGSEWHIEMDHMFAKLVPTFAAWLEAIRV